MSNAALPSRPAHPPSVVVPVLLLTLVAAVGAMLLPTQPAPDVEPNASDQTAFFVSYPEHDPSVPRARDVFEGREMPIEETPPTF